MEGANGRGAALAGKGGDLNWRTKSAISGTETDLAAKTRPRSSRIASERPTGTRELPGLGVKLVG